MKTKFEYFECQKCGAIISIDISKNNDKKTINPVCCDEKQGGCGSVSKFIRLKKEYVNDKQSEELDKKILRDDI